MAAGGDTHPWLYTAVVENVPDYYSDDDLKSSLYDASGLLCQVEARDHHSHTALVLFSEEITEELKEDVSVTLQQTGQGIQLKKINEPPRTVLVQNVDPTVPQDFLVRFFEAELCPGREDMFVEDCCMYPELGWAVVTFFESSDAYLAVCEHTCASETIGFDVELFYPVFHEPLLAAMLAETEEFTGVPWTDSADLPAGYESKPQTAKTEQSQPVRSDLVQLPPHQVDLLSGLVHELPCKCQRQDSAFLLSGTENECDAAKLKILETVQELQEEKIPNVPQPVLYIMKTGKWMTGVYGKFRQDHPDCSVAVLGQEIVCTARNQQALQAAIRDLKMNIQQRTCKVSTGLLKTAEFRQKTSQLEQDLLVQVTLPESGSDAAVIDGYGEDVQTAHGILSAFCNARAFATKQITLSRPQAKALREWFASDLQAVKESARTQDCDIKEETAADGTVIFTVDGRSTAVEEAGQKLSSLVAKVTVTTVDIHAMFPSSTDRELIISGLRDFEPDLFCEKLSREMNRTGIACIVDITLPPKSQTAARRSSISGATEGRYVKAPAARTGAGNRVRGLVKSRFGRSRSVPDLSLGASDISADGAAFCVLYRGAKITVTNGDVTEIKTDVLVSVVGTDLDLKKTAVGKAIVDKSPSQAQLVREATQSSSGQRPFRVLKSKVAAGDALPSCNILHAVIGQCSDNATLKKNIRLLVRQCLKETDATGFSLFGRNVPFAFLNFLKKKTVVFPPIGIGRRFRFQEDVVIAAMVQGTFEYLHETKHSIKEVKFVAHEEDLCRKFVDEVNTRMADEAETQAPLRSAKASKSSYQAPEQTRPEARELPEIETSRPSSNLTALVCTKSDSSVSAKDKLKTELKSAFLCERPISPDFDQLDRNSQSEIRREASARGIRVDGSAGAFVARGREANVLHVLQLVTEKSKGRTAKRPVSSGKPKHAEWPSSKSHRLPAYWRVCRGREHCSFEGATISWKSWGKFNSVSPEEKDAVENLLQATWNSQLVGQGRDAKNLSHKNIQVIKVERLENPGLYEKFSNHRKSLFIKIQGKDGKLTPLKPVENLPNSKGPVLTTFIAHELLKRQIYQEVNEHYLFHGTLQKYIPNIVEEGLDFRVAKDTGLHGKGTYFAECTSKSDQYTDSKESRADANSELTIIVARVLLGRPYISTDPNPVKYQRPPCVNCFKDVCECKPLARFDSVIDNSGRLFREFIRTQCYPEYFVTYKRLN